MTNVSAFALFLGNWSNVRNLWHLPVTKRSDVLASIETQDALWIVLKSCWRTGSSGFTQTWVHVVHAVSHINSTFHLNVTLDHKTSHKSHGFICSNSQKYIAWVKIIDFSFMPKIIRILSKDHVPLKIFCKFPTVKISKLFSIFRFFCTLRFQIFI